MCLERCVIVYVDVKKIVDDAKRERLRVFRVF
jgi:hypothetical protein